MIVTPTVSILTQLGLRVDASDESRVCGEAIVRPDICDPRTGLLRTSMLATWTDVVAGVAAIKATAPRIPVTLDLETQLTGVARAGTIVDVETRAIKVGRITALFAVHFTDARSGSPVAASFVTFVRSPDPDHLFDRPFPPFIERSGWLDQPLADRLQRRSISRGVIEMPRLSDGLNATGSIQGGLLAVAAEEAAFSLAADPILLRALTIRYLRPFATGPVRAIATGDDLLSTIDLTDLGSGKLGAVATARTERVTAARPG